MLIVLEIAAILHAWRSRDVAMANGNTHDSTLLEKQYLNIITRIV